MAVHLLSALPIRISRTCVCSCLCSQNREGTRVWAALFVSLSTNLSYAIPFKKPCQRPSAQSGMTLSALLSSLCSIKYTILCFTYCLCTQKQDLNIQWSVLLASLSKNLSCATSAKTSVPNSQRLKHGSIRLLCCSARSNVTSCILTTFCHLEKKLLYSITSKALISPWTVLLVSLFKIFGHATYVKIFRRNRYIMHYSGSFFLLFQLCSTKYLTLHVRCKNVDQHSLSRSVRLCPKLKDKIINSRI